MKKALLLKKIVERLNENLAMLAQAAHASHVEATHESSKAESKYDTRGLEAAYLAGGQARQAREILESVKAYQGLALRDFGAGDGIDLGAVVKLETDGASAFFFIGPRGGGLEVEHDGEEITVITPQSPVGQNLMGKKSGEKWSAKINGRMVKYWVKAVW